MGIFKRKEKRSADGMVEVGDNLLTALIGGSSEVTKAEALQIPTVSACVNLIADRISALPIKLYRENGKEVEEITEDNRLNMLNHDTGDTINATEMKKLWIRDYFLGKGSYTYIERNLFNEPTGLLYVDETRLAVAPGVDPIHKTYSIQVNGRVYFPYQFLKILRNSKGFGTGTSIISEDPLALAIYYNTMKFENATIRKGGNKKGYILAKSKLTQDAMDKVKEAWRKLYSNSYDTKDNAVVLNEGLDFKESSSTSVELQLNENKRTNADEICKLFCMPADVLNGKADEHMISQFVQNCLMPLINTIESALDTDLLTEAEKAGHYYFAFDTSELTRGDFASRMNGYATALQNNIYQLDEIREMEDKPPLGFNFIKLGLDAVLVDPKTREIYTPNTGKLEKMNTEHLTDEQIRAILEERYNPYHDPTNGRFTTADMGGWGSGAALYVGKGEAGSGKYIFDSKNSNKSGQKIKAENDEQFEYAKYYGYIKGASSIEFTDSDGKIRKAETGRKDGGTYKTAYSQKVADYSQMPTEYLESELKRQRIISDDNYQKFTRQAASKSSGLVKGFSDADTEILAIKQILRRRKKSLTRALPVDDDNYNLTDEDICDILESRGQRRYKQNPTTGLMEGSYPAYGVKMSKKEIWAVSSGLKTDHPNLKSGEFFPYEYGNHFYLVDPLDSGGYRFMKKISLTPRNQARINRIRKEYGHNE